MYARGYRRSGLSSHPLVEVLLLALDHVDSRGGSIPVIVVIVVPRHAPVISVDSGIPEHIDLVSQVLVFVRLVEVYVLGQVGHDFG